MKRILQLVMISILAFPCLSWGRGGHANPVTGPSRSADAPRGSCGQCHVNKGDKGGRHDKGLWRENDNELCYSCHREENAAGSYPGQRLYILSGHATDPRTLWPGPVPAGRRGGAGLCLNCHTPHGRKDRSGEIPTLLVARDEALCLACHSGYPSGKDVGRDNRKPYGHASIKGSGRHEAGEGGDSDRYSYSSGKRHVSCSDCHNAHAACGDSLAPQPPQASNGNLRVGRVHVENAGPGEIPFYQYRPAGDASAVLEYEICFKCHSSWTRQPPGQPDLARLFSTANASFHPVESRGKNPGISQAAFTGGVSAFSMVLCSDCHGSDDTSARGPHGSQFAGLLRKEYPARSISRPVGREELCFICHAFEPYAGPSAPAAVQQASRFNEPQSRGGHALHAGRNVPCYACHDSHGSAKYPALIVTGRVPGITSFTSSANGGSCQTTCHGPRSYTVNYLR